MAFFNAKFDDIRLIISIQGYALNYQYIIREIGFWSRSICGLIPFNCKLNRSQLDNISLKNIHIAANEIHGIKQKKTIENALPSSDAYAVIKCLYHLTKRENIDSDYIGISKEENIAPLIYKSGLGNYIFELDNLDLFKSTNIKFPTIADIKYIIASDSKKYNFCNLHDKLRNDEIPLCAKVKCEIIANYIQQQLLISAQQQQQQQHQQATYSLAVFPNQLA
jgi:hypothetical protein